MRQSVRTGALSKEAWRDWTRILGLWRVCGKAACRRAGACRGNVRACVPVNFANVPEGVRAWFACLMVAKENGLSFDEAIAQLKGTPAEEAFHAWRAGDVTAAPPSAKGRRRGRYPDTLTGRPVATAPIAESLPDSHSSRMPTGRVD